MPAPATFERSLLAVAVALATMAAACSGGSGRDVADAANAGAGDDTDAGDQADSPGDEIVPTYAPTFTAVYAEIVGPMCAGTFCHGGADDAFLPMGTQAMAYAATVGVVSHGPDCASTGLQIVDPGNPDASLLYLKVTNPPCGNKMPAEYEPYLDARQTEQISQWITLGALDD
jgi:hypothetical protein